jgi:glucoamylase
MRLYLLIVVLGGVGTTLFTQTTNNFAPGAPGADAHWPTAAKNGLGTANSTASKVWFTLADGVMTEVYYPTLDVPNVQTLELVVVDGDRRNVETEQQDTTHEMQVPDPRALEFRQMRSRRSDYVITKTYTADTKRPTVLIHVTFESPHHYPYFVYVYYDPSLNNSGMHDTAWTQGDALMAIDGDKVSALISTRGFDEMTNGYLGASDGLQQLKRDGRITQRYARAKDGNVTQMARVKPDLPFTLALGFGKTSEEALSNARASLSEGFTRLRNEYEAGWYRYVDQLPRVEAKYRKQFNMAAMVLKALEDKTYRGAIIASPSTPWGGGPNANEPTIGGYHAVWSRDLYEVATALNAIGDQATANRALDYLFNVQQKPDGSFPQNTWVDGRQIGGGLQMDEVAFPIILAYQLRRTDGKTWAKHIKPAADFIVQHGPATGQDRWEEKSGYSAATIAAEIAGLVCAARIARLNDDERSAGAYLKSADDWARNVERWTATSNGPYGDGHYYLRIAENGNPNDGAKIEINSGGGIFDEREIVDAGFLELVRLGVKRADDPLIRKSLEAVDKLIKVDTLSGPGWYRYNHDAYGERPDGQPYDGQRGVGRLWTLLSGERGEYELARGDIRAARNCLDTMMSFANNGLMIPEQVWDRAQSPTPQFHFGAGTGSATPLAWSMAQFIRLAMNIRAGRNLETPDIVADRYLNRSRARR